MEEERGLEGRENRKMMAERKGMNEERERGSNVMAGKKRRGREKELKRVD